MKHTPGPWGWIPYVWRGGYLGLYGANDSYVIYPQRCNDGDSGDAWFEEISDADRSLIAAAPDLLEALEQLESTVRILSPHMDQPENALAMARAALAKARGEQ